MMLRLLCALLLTACTPAVGDNIFTDSNHVFGTSQRRVVSYTTVAENACLSAGGACYNSVQSIAHTYLEAYEASREGGGRRLAEHEYERNLGGSCCSQSRQFWICQMYWGGCNMYRRHLTDTMANGNPSPPTLDMGNLGQFVIVSLGATSRFKWQKSVSGWAGDIFVSGDADTEDPQELLFGSKIYTDGEDGPDFFQKLKLIKDTDKNKNGDDVDFVYGQTEMAGELSAKYDDMVSEMLSYSAHEGFANAVPDMFYNPGAVNFQNGISETIVIDIKNDKVENGDVMYVTGDEEDIIIFRWDEDWQCQAKNGCEGKVEFKGGAAIVPLGGLTMNRIYNMAEEIASGNEDRPPSEFDDWNYDSPHFEDGTKMSNGKKFRGGFFSGFWFVTGDHFKCDKGMFIGGMYTKAAAFELSESGGMHINPPAPLDWIEEAADERCWRSVGVAADATFVLDMENQLADLDAQVEGVKIAIQEKVPCNE